MSTRAVSTTGWPTVPPCSTSYWNDVEPLKLSAGVNTSVGSVR